VGFVPPEVPVGFVPVGELPNPPDEPPSPPGELPNPVPVVPNPVPELPKPVELPNPLLLFTEPPPFICAAAAICSIRGS
jgi:hypothetical protein